MPPPTNYATTPPPVVETTRRLLTPNNRALAVLQSIIETLPMDQLLCHTPRSIQSWPTAAHNEILAVAHQDLAVARYLDMHSAQLAACAGAMDDTVLLMSAETFPRTSGGIRSALQEL